MEPTPLTHGRYTHSGSWWHFSFIPVKCLIHHESHCSRPHCKRWGASYPGYFTWMSLQGKYMRMRQCETRDMLICGHPAQSTDQTLPLRAGVKSQSSWHICCRQVSACTIATGKCQFLAMCGPRVKRMSQKYPRLFQRWLWPHLQTNPRRKATSYWRCHQSQKTEECQHFPVWLQLFLNDS